MKLSTYNKITIILLICIVFFYSNNSTYKKKFTLILDPSTNLNNRIIDNNYELGCNIQFAAQISKIIKENFQNIEIFIYEANQLNSNKDSKINYINKISPNLVISLNTYKAKSKNIEIACYYFSLEPKIEVLYKKNSFYFYKKNQAHILNMEQTKQYSNLLLETLKNDNINCAFKLIYNKSIAAPCKKLKGIIAPAILIECGINNKNDLENLTAIFIDFFNKINLTIN